jgi:hypothetical protein
MQALAQDAVQGHTVVPMQPLAQDAMLGHIAVVLVQFPAQVAVQESTVE